MHPAKEHGSSRLGKRSHVTEGTAPRPPTTAARALGRLLYAGEGSAPPPKIGGVTRRGSDTGLGAAGAGGTGRRAAAARRELLAAHQEHDVVAGERLALEERDRHLLQQHAVLGERDLGPVVRLGDDALHLGVHELGGLLAHLAAVLQLAAQEELLLVVADQHRADGVREAPLRDVARAIPVACWMSLAAPVVTPVAAEHQLLGDAAAVRHHEPRLELLAGHAHAVVLGQREREAEAPAARHDRDLVQRVVPLTSIAHTRGPPRGTPSGGAPPRA
jgi:hypothetical protein